MNGFNGQKVNDVERSRGRWSKVAASVINDKELSACAKVVFCELTLWLKRGERNVSRGQRSIAAAVGIHQETALEALRELAKNGHIAIHGFGRERRSYELKSWVYRERKQEWAKKKKVA